MSKLMQEAYIVAATRTPVAKRNGAFRFVRPDDMLAHVLRAVLAEVPQLDQKEIGEVVVGCAIPEGEQGMNVARMGVLLAGMPDCVPAYTLNRFCSSGLNSVAHAAQMIQMGLTDVAIGAGTESMSVMSQMLGNKAAPNPKFFESNEAIALAYGMGLTAERVAEKWQISREEQDIFAAASHEKALRAIAEGHFKAEISPYQVNNQLPDLTTGRIQSQSFLFEHDEGARAGTTVETLAKLRPIFAAGRKATVTAGNASQMSDGAAAVLVMSEAALKRYNLTPIARYSAFSVAGVPPEIMGIGPIEAIPRALKMAGIQQHQLDWIELNEAFAAQALAVIKQLDLDSNRINPLGGAIALGHPLGATGAIRVATIMSAFQRNPKLKHAMVSMCIGTGMGAAGIFERV
jgi:acetyl-CoA acyltransferase